MWFGDYYLMTAKLHDLNCVDDCSTSAELPLVTQKLMTAYG